MRTTWCFSALVAAVAVAGLASDVRAASVSSQCAAVTTCYKGGDTSNACTVADGGCPVCVTFADDGCYVKVDGECPFGNDCTDEFSATSGSASSTASSSASATGSSKSTTGSSTSGTTSTSSGASASASNSTSGTSSSTSSGSGSSATSTSDSSSSGSDLSVVFAIIGAAIGVIAVAVIFLTLVRRSRAAADDEDDLADTPPAFTKNVAQAPASTTGTVNYSSYGGSGRSTGVGSGEAKEIGGYSSGGANRALGASGGPGASSGVVNYYSQQPPQNSAAPSPRVAGRAIPSVPVGMAQPQGSMRSAAPAPAPAPYAEMARPGQAQPTPVQHYPVTGGVAPSPVTKRESYEF